MVLVRLILLLLLITPLQADVRAVIFDMDGVVRRGFEPIEGAAECIAWLGDSEIPGLLFTNECRYSPEQIRHDLHLMEISYPPTWPIYTAALATRDFLTDIYPTANALAYVVGEQGLRLAVEQVPNLRICNTLPPRYCGELLVILGAVDRMRISDLEEALKWVRAGAKVLTTSPDLADPLSTGELPLSKPGHMVQIINMHTPCNPYCVGKPNPIMMRRCLKLLRHTIPDLQPNEILLIGDSLNTDVRGAIEAGFQSALVLTGNTDRNDIDQTLIKPHHIFDDLYQLIEFLQ